MLSRGMSVIKYMLFLFNVAFVITGIIVLSVGIAVQGFYWDYHHFLDDRYLSAPNLLIAVGSIILLVSFLGCCGAFKENHCMIVSYVSLLIVIFILELSAGIAGYVCRSSAGSVLHEKLQETMPHFDSKDPSYNDITSLWQYVQKSFHCCGIDGPSDWGKAGTYAGNATQLPLSCCSLPSVGPFSCTLNTSVTPAADVYKDGCAVKLTEFVQDKVVAIGGVGITISLVQLAGILMACRLAGAMRRAQLSDMSPP